MTSSCSVVAASCSQVRGAPQGILLSHEHVIGSGPMLRGHALAHDLCTHSYRACDAMPTSVASQGGLSWCKSKQIMVEGHCCGWEACPHQHVQPSPTRLLATCNSCSTSTLTLDCHHKPRAPCMARDHNLVGQADGRRSAAAEHVRSAHADRLEQSKLARSTSAL